MTPPPHLNIFHCYPHQPPLPLPPIKFLLYIRHNQKDHEAPCPAAQHHPTQPIHHPSHHLFYCLGLDTRKVWKFYTFLVLETRKVYNNSPQPPFVLLPRFGYEKSMKILYFPHIGNEEGIKFYTFLVSNTRKVCHFLKCQEVYQYSKQVYQCSKSIPSTSIFLRSI